MNRREALRLFAIGAGCSVAGIPVFANPLPAKFLTALEEYKKGIDREDILKRFSRFFWNKDPLKGLYHYDLNLLRRYMGNDARQKHRIFFYLDEGHKLLERKIFFKKDLNYIDFPDLNAKIAAYGTGLFIAEYNIKHLNGITTYLPELEYMCIYSYDTDEVFMPQEAIDSVINYDGKYTANPFYGTDKYYDFRKV